MAREPADVVLDLGADRQLDRREGARLLDPSRRHPGGLDADDPGDDPGERVASAQQPHVLEPVEEGDEEGTSEHRGGKPLERGLEVGSLDGDEAGVDRAVELGGHLDRDVDVAEHPAVEVEAPDAQRVRVRTLGEAHDPVAGAGEERAEKAADPARPEDGEVETLRRRAPGLSCVHDQAILHHRRDRAAVREPEDGAGWVWTSL